MHEETKKKQIMTCKYDMSKEAKFIIKKNNNNKKLMRKISSKKTF